MMKTNWRWSDPYDHLYCCFVMRQPIDMLPETNSDLHHNLRKEISNISRSLLHENFSTNLVSNIAKNRKKAD
jgi:ABC-type thiamine transport system ATPase subunit